VCKHHINKLDLLKIDVEGHEADVLLGLKKTIEKHQPIIVLEWNNDVTRQKFQTFNIFNTLLQRYTAFELTGNRDYRAWKRKFHYENKIYRRISFLLYSKLHASKFWLRPFYHNHEYFNVILYPDTKDNLFSDYIE
jgi:hypothetical protein